MPIIYPSTLLWRCWCFSRSVMGWTSSASSRREGTRSIVRQLPIFACLLFPEQIAPQFPLLFRVLLSWTSKFLQICILFLPKALGAAKIKIQDEVEIQIAVSVKKRQRFSSLCRFCDSSSRDSQSQQQDSTTWVPNLCSRMGMTWNVDHCFQLHSRSTGMILLVEHQE
jgi:hypothetical protein